MHFAVAIALSTSAFPRVLPYSAAQQNPQPGGVHFIPGQARIRTKAGASWLVTMAPQRVHHCMGYEVPRAGGGQDLGLGVDNTWRLIFKQDQGGPWMLSFHFWMLFCCCCIRQDIFTSPWIAKKLWAWVVIFPVLAMRLSPFQRANHRWWCTAIAASGRVLTIPTTPRDVKEHVNLVEMMPSPCLDRDIQQLLRVFTPLTKILKAEAATVHRPISSHGTTPSCSRRATQPGATGQLL